MSYPTVAGRAVEGLLFREARSCLGTAFASSFYLFFLAGTSTPANVYQNGTLTTPFSPTGRVTSDSFGRFPAIYLDPSVIYRVQFFNSLGVQQWQVDPYSSQLSTVGTSSLTAFGPKITAFGEVTFAAPNTGGSGLTLTLKSGALGSAALRLNGTLPGNSAIIVNSSATTGAQTATFTATNKPGTSASAPAAWLPITCDGVQYYTPLWYDNSNFTPYTPSPSANGEVIVASSVLFGGTGLTTATNGTATPGNWFSPASTNVGAGYYINITKTSGLSAVAFSAAQGSWVNIGAGGLTITSNAQSAISGTYQLSTSVTGSPVVAAGTITLSNNNGVQSPTINGATPLNLAGNGTATLNSVGTSNWFAPTTSNVGSGFWILINQTGGTTGYTFSAATGSPANITNGGITVGINGTGSATFNVSGTYIISSDSGGVNQLGSGTITLTGSNVQSPNYSGNIQLKLNGDGSATQAGAGASSWYSPNTSNVGSLFWLNITNTGAGTSGVNFSAAQGAWTNITNSGITIDLNGYSGNVVGTATALGTYQISSSSSGTPVLGSGTVSLSVTGLTVVHVYTAAGSGTETAPTGTSNVSIEVYSGISGGGGGSLGGGSTGGSGGGGAGPSYARSTYAMSAGQTLAYTVGVAGAGGSAVFSGAAGNGTAGGTSSVSSGTLTISTMTCTAGGFGTGGNNVAGGTGGAASAASGGNVLNQNGGAGGTASTPPGSSIGAAGTFYNTPVHCGFQAGAGNNQGGSGSLQTSGGAGSTGVACFFYS